MRPPSEPDQFDYDLPDGGEIPASDEAGYYDEAGQWVGAYDEEVEEEQGFDLGAFASQQLAAEDEQEDLEEEEEEEDEEDEEEDEDGEPDANLLMDFKRRSSYDGVGRGTFNGNQRGTGTPSRGRGAGQRGGSNQTNGQQNYPFPQQQQLDIASFLAQQAQSGGQQRGGRILPSGVRVGPSNQHSPSDTPPQTPSLRGDSQGGRGRGRGGGGGRGGRGGLNASPGKIGAESISPKTFEQLKDYAANLPETKAFFAGYVVNLENGKWDLLTFFSKAYSRITLAQFAEVENFFTPEQRAIFTDDLRVKGNKKKPSDINTDADDTPVKRNINEQSPTFVSGPASKKPRLSPPAQPQPPRPPIPTYTPSSNLATSQPIGPRPPTSYPVPPRPPGRPPVAKDDVLLEFDSTANAGIDVSAEERLLMPEGVQEMLRYSVPPKNLAEARGLVKSRMNEIMEKETPALKASDGAVLAIQSALDDLLRSLVEKMIVASKHRNGIYRQMLEEDAEADEAAGRPGIKFMYEKTSDVKAEIEARRNRERNKEMEERRRIEERNQAEAEGREVVVEPKKKKQSAKQREMELSEEVKADNARRAIQATLGQKAKTYGWLDGGTPKGDSVVPAVRMGGAKDKEATTPVTAKTLRNQQRLELHAKKLAKVVNVEDAMLVLEKDRRFRQSRALMRWATWREAKLVQAPK